MKLNQILLATLVAGAFVTTHAGIVGTTSNTSNLRIGVVGQDVSPSDPPNHTGDVNGSVGVAVIESPATTTTTNKYVGLAGLQARAENATTRITTNIGGKDSAGIVQLDFNKWNLPSPIPNHKPLGRFAYKEIAGTTSQYNVYFGEWYKTGTGVGLTDASHTVFFAGDNGNLTLPGSGSATYSVTGINQYGGTVNSVAAGWVGNATTAAPNTLLTGTLTANFTGKTLTGELNRTVSGSASDVTNKLVLDNTTFTSTGAINGSAKLNGASTATGTVKGSFFGPSAASLAGIATFSNVKYDTAFGGTKNP